MKICPTCKSKLFDDMDTCFGCMHRFGTDPEREREAEALSWPPSLEDVNEGAVFEEAVPWPAGPGPAPCPAPPPASPPGYAARGERTMGVSGLVLRVLAGDGAPGAPLLTITIEPA